MSERIIKKSPHRVGGIGAVRVMLAIYQQVKEMRGRRQQLAERCMDAYHRGDRKGAEKFYHKYCSTYTEI